MSCDHQLANEWARCSGKNSSYITNFLMSVEPPSSTGKIQHRLKFLAFKTCSNCIGRSWNSSTERPERRLHWCCEPPCLQQSNLGVPVCMKSSLTCLEKTWHARFLRYVYAPVESTEFSTHCQKLTSILIFLVGYNTRHICWNTHRRFPPPEWGKGDVV